MTQGLDADSCVIYAGTFTKWSSGLCVSWLRGAPY